MDLSERRGSTGRRHPWEQARAAFVVDLLRTHLPSSSSSSSNPPTTRILDIGSGDAWVANQVVKGLPGASVTCWDIHYTDAELREFASADITPTREAPTETFDVAMLLDVLEHVDDDGALLRSALQRLKPGGLVVVTVPAWPRLFSAHDHALAHVRRYTPAACDEVLRRGGLRLLATGGFFHGLLVPRAASLVVERLRGKPHDVPTLGTWGGGAAITAGITAALRAEQRASLWAARRGWQVPGLSYFACGVLEA